MTLSITLALCHVTLGHQCDEVILDQIKCSALIVLVTSLIT